MLNLDRAAVAAESRGFRDGAGGLIARAGAGQSRVGRLRARVDQCAARVSRFRWQLRRCQGCAGTTTSPD